MLYSDEYWMDQAIELAKQAEQENEIPVAALVVRDNELIASAYNQSIQLNDPSAHAEVLAIRKAGHILKNYRLIDCRLYVTLEPCSMCAGLLVHSRLKQVIFGASDAKTGACGSIMNIAAHPALNHQLDIVSGVLAEQASHQLSAFFKRRRAEIKQQKKLQQAIASLKSE